MIFKRKKKQDTTSLANSEVSVYEQLQTLCGLGTIEANGFFIPEYHIQMYADVVTLDEHMAQVIFQIHHAFLEEPIVCAVNGNGQTEEESLECASLKFYTLTLSIYLHALMGKGQTSSIAGYTQEKHDYRVFAGPIISFSKREGMIAESHWDVIAKGIMKRLGNKRVYWIEILCMKNENEVNCEVRVNQEVSQELSNLFLEDTMNWDCLGKSYSETQNILIVQDEVTFIASDFTKEDICRYTKKAIACYESCSSKEDYRKLRTQLIKVTKDNSLAMELFSFIPEIYCMHSYRDISFGDQLFLIRKNEKTQDLYQTQLQSFSYIKQTVLYHLKKDVVSEEQMQNVLTYSIHARAIQKAIDQGEDVSNLYTPGIGYYVKDDYIFR